MDRYSSVQARYQTSITGRGKKELRKEGMGRRKGEGEMGKKKEGKGRRVEEG